MDKKYKRKKSLKFLWLLDIPIGCCIFLMVIGLLMGSVFVIGTWHWGKLIGRDDAIAVKATYLDHEILTSNKGSINGVEIYFTDRESLHMDGATFVAAVEVGLDGLKEGDALELLIHPNSEDIWELRFGDAVILDFEDAKSRMLVDNILFTILGIFCYLCFAMGAASLIMQLVQWKKENKKAKGNGMRAVPHNRKE